MRDLKQILGGHPVFEGIDERHLDVIVGCAGNVVFDADQEIFRAGQPADTFYLLREGTIALELHPPSGPTLLVDTLHAGDVLGWSWLFPPYTWHTDARAVTRTRALALDGACLRSKADDDPALGYELMRRFARIIIDRLQATRLQLMDVYGHVAPL